MFPRILDFDPEVLDRYRLDESVRILSSQKLDVVYYYLKPVDPRVFLGLILRLSGRLGLTLSKKNCFGTKKINILVTFSHCTIICFEQFAPLHCYSALYYPVLLNLTYLPPYTVIWPIRFFGNCESNVKSFVSIVL